jgi:ABC-type glutathione transport system ATPase component
MQKDKELIQVLGLKVSVKGKDKVILNEIDFTCNQSEILTILGKNGEGKTTLALSLTKLLNPQIYSIEGKVYFRNEDILNLDENSLQKIRKEQIGYILQNPFSAFNPIYKIKDQIEELNKLKNIPFENFIQLMNKLELKNHNQILSKYPFELSGGMLQRLSAVRVLASNPDLIIADEPTSALDKPISNQLLKLFRDYVKERNGALIFITQDISIAESFSDKIAFLKNGNLIHFVERENLFKQTNHIEIEILLNSYRQLRL